VAAVSGVVYSDEAQIRLPAVHRLHPFDVRTHQRAFRALEVRYGSRLRVSAFAPAEQAGVSDLLTVHSSRYLESLASGRTLASAFGIAALRLIPPSIRRARIIDPLLYGVKGTILAAELALERGIVFHIGGGFHHASASRAEGSCIFADAAIAIQALRARRLLQYDDSILYIDLDAHRGNGVQEIFRSDPAIRILDVFNDDIYPGCTRGSWPSNWRLVPVRSGCADAEYIDLVKREIDQILARGPLPKFAVYNAGTDIVRGDPLGCLDVSPDGVVRRDRLVIDALRKTSVPTVVLASGGYSKLSHSLIARTAAHILDLD
jgi:histone deacetylase 11